MRQPGKIGLTRRQAVLGAAAVAALGRIGQTAAAVRSSRGMAGGGLIALPDGLAHFSLFASRTISDDGTEVVVGQVRWFDPGAVDGGLTLESTEVTDYVPLDDDENGRELRGTIRVNDNEYPFVLQAFDDGAPGSGLDRVSLRVGGLVNGTAEATTATDDLVYEGEGSLAAGDLQLLVFDID